MLIEKRLREQKEQREQHEQYGQIQEELREQQQ
jgi:hypothetical protein